MVTSPTEISEINMERLIQRQEVSDRRTSVGCMLAFSLALFFSEDIRAAEPVAMVSDCVGKASISTSHNTKPCEILTNLSPGAKLRLASGDQVTVVYFSSGKEFAFMDQAEITIGEEGPTRNTGGAPKVRNLALVKETGLVPSGGQGYQQAAIVLRNIKTQKKLQLLTPNNTALLETSPRFRWESIERGIQYRFTLIDESGRIIIETLVNSTEFQTPAQVKLTEGTVYIWQLEARTASGVVYSNSADFTLLERAERERLERVRPGPNAPVSERVVFATVLEQMNLHDEAKKHWKALLGDRPNSPKLEARAIR